MAKIGKQQKVRKTVEAIPAHRTIGKEGISFSYLKEKVALGSNGLPLPIFINDRMKVRGSFKRVPGMFGVGIFNRDEILSVLYECKEGAEFIGIHAGRRVVGVKRRVGVTLVFADSYSPYLPPLPTTCF